MPTCLVTGSSGYVGSRLVAKLQTAGRTVVASARDVDKLTRFDWPDDVRRLQLDVEDSNSCRAAFEAAGAVDVAYFLVHSIGDRDFAAQDLNSARQFAAAARRAGVNRIVYLGGFVPDDAELSQHLDSRAAVGHALGAAGVELVWLRAAIVLGAGSTSFELIRHIADRVPIIPLPTWMNHPVAPIAVDDVLYYLDAAADLDTLPPGAYDISCGEEPTYGELIKAYAASRGLRRLWVPFPPIPPAWVAAIAARITPVPRELTTDLILSLPNTMSSTDKRIRTHVGDPPGGLTTVAAALARSLQPHKPTGVAATPDPVHLAETDPDWSRSSPVDDDSG